MLTLKPYFPNCRRQYIETDLPKFNWFLCGTKYYDSKLKSHIISLPKGTLLYSEESGKSYQTIKEETTFRLGKRWVKKYDGTASLDDCAPSKNPIWCKEATVTIAKTFVKDVSKKCKMIDYAKANNNSIRRQIPSFPTCEELDELLDKSTWCKVTKNISEDLNQLFICED